jgi:hypothetical protein
MAFFIACSLSIKSNLPSFVSRTPSSSLNSGFMINKDVVCIKTVFSSIPQSLTIFMACAMVGTRLPCEGADDALTLEVIFSVALLIFIHVFLYIQKNGLFSSSFSVGLDNSLLLVWVSHCSPSPLYHCHLIH